MNLMATIVELQNTSNEDWLHHHQDQNTHQDHSNYDRGIPEERVW